ncbi:Ig domain-containing protein, partial [Brucella intermedia]|uniref:Ig domain-containing protein n=1 Tax=Brucella TaxID=234 RepID=UPI003B9880DF
IKVTVDSAGGQLPVPVYNQAYSAKYKAEGGIGDFTFTKESGELPPGLTLASNGELSGTPTKSGPFSFTVKATDTNNVSGTREEEVTIAAPEITLDLSQLVDGKEGLVYGPVQVTAGGGAEPYSYSFENLPEGLTQNADGTVSGTPTKAGAASVKVTVTDKHGTAASQTKEINIKAKPEITLDLSQLVDGKQDLAYGPVEVKADKGTEPYEYKIEGLPEGLKAEGNRISGTPTKAGSATVTVTVTDKDGYEKSATKEISIKAKPTITVDVSGFHRGYVGVEYAPVTVKASGSEGPYTYKFSGLPAGLSGDEQTGIVSGVPSQSGGGRVTVTAEDADGYKGEGKAEFGIWAPPTVPELPDAKQNRPYSHTVTSSGGTGRYEVEISDLPEGLTAKGNAISGTPTVSGEFPVAIKLTDNDGNAIPLSRTITIKAAPEITLDLSQLVDGKQSLPYGPVKVTAGGGAEPYTFSFENLPEGLTQKSDGTVAGTPTEAGSATVTVTVTDKDGYEKSATKGISIKEKPAITVTALTPAKQGVSYSHTLQAEGGTSPYTFTADTLPQGLELR